MADCGLYELVVDLRGEVVAVGAGAAALTRHAPETLVGSPVTRFLRGPVMTAPPGRVAPVTIKRAEGGNASALGLRALVGDHLHLTLLPSPEAKAAAPAGASPRLRTIERLVDEVVRDVHNPLTGIMGFAALAQLAPTPHRRRYYLDQVATQAQRCRRLLQSLDVALRPATPYPAPVDLAELVAQTLGTVRLQLEGHGISIELVLPSAPVWVESDPKLLGDALVCLIHRATVGFRKEYCAREVTLRVGDSPEVGPQLDLVFGGCDVKNDVLRERFAGEAHDPRAVPTLSDVEFAAATDQLREQGSKLTIASEADGEELHITVVLPRSAPPRRVDQSRTPVPLDILTIDDDAMMGELYHELLGVSGHTVTPCRSLRAAREALRTQRFDAVIADFYFSDGTLPELWAEAAAQHPELTERLVLVTGDRSAAPVREWLQRGRTPVLPKPFTTQALLALIANFTP